VPCPLRWGRRLVVWDRCGDWGLSLSSQPVDCLAPCSVWFVPRQEWELWAQVSTLSYWVAYCWTRSESSEPSSRVLYCLFLPAQGRFQGSVCFPHSPMCSGHTPRLDMMNRRSLKQVGTYAAHRSQRSLGPAVAPDRQGREASKVNAALKLTTDLDQLGPRPISITSLNSKVCNRFQQWLTTPHLADSAIKMIQEEQCLILCHLLNLSSFPNFLHFLSV
jgi:hypothetical protein